MKSYKVEIYLPTSKKYSGTFDLNLDDSAWKVVNNIAVMSNGSELSHATIKGEIDNLEAGKALIFWCEVEAGAYARVEAK